MKDFWLAIYMLIAVLVVFCLPFYIFLYETDEEDGVIKRIWTAFFYECITLIVVSLILFISWAFLKFAEIPITVYSKTAAELESSIVNINYQTFKAQPQTSKEAFLELAVSFPIYVLTLMSFVGWILFVIFCGVGLTALPLDLILEFTSRPKLVLIKTKIDDQ